MLVLTRRVDEKIIMTGGISIMVLGISSDGKVRLGIDAPKSVVVHREEVWKQVERKEAAEAEAAANKLGMPRVIPLVGTYVSAENEEIANRQQILKMEDAEVASQGHRPGAA